MPRVEIVITLLLTHSPDIPAVKNTGQYRDIPKGIWFEPYMLYAAKLGIIIPDGTGKLRPYASVTRADFLRMLALTFGLTQNLPHSYTDISETDWVANFAGIAHAYHLFKLTDATKLEPNHVLTRTEALDAFQQLQTMQKQGAQIALESTLAAEQSKNKLRLYNVISTRTERVALIQESSAPRTPLVRHVPIPASLPELRTIILTMVNDIRSKEGLSALTYNSQLEQSAQGYADLMAEEGFFGHVSPDGETLRDRIQVTGFEDRTFSPDCFCVRGYAFGENLARGQKTAKAAVEAWMHSPAHRAAILNPDYTDTGIGVNAGIWVQHFGGILLPGQPIYTQTVEE